jgi:polysaccharide biosynthesis/export protein
MLREAIFRMRLFPTLCAFAVAGCSTSAPDMLNTGRVGIVDAGNLPAPNPTDIVASQRRPYVVGPLDKLTVEVMGIEDLTREVVVDPNGFIALPIAGSINVAGMTPAEIAAEVERRLAEGYVREPKVAVGMTETMSQLVTVDGEVGTPGIYPVVGRMTLMRAVARAGGTTEFADTNHVVVFREVGGQPMATLYDLRAIRLGAYEDPEIYPNDVLHVGESRASRLFPQIVTAAGILLTPLVTILAR